MSTAFGVSGYVLLWFKSYIIGRSQSIYLPTGSSVKRAVWCGVPQSSVLSIILLALYAAENHHRTTKVNARHGLQSTDNLSLTIPSTRLSTLGDRAIPVVASQAWNSLPISLRNIESLQIFYQELKKRRSFHRRLTESSLIPSILMLNNCTTFSHCCHCRASLVDFVKFSCNDCVISSL